MIKLLFAMILLITTACASPELPKIRKPPKEINKKMFPPGYRVVSGKVIVLKENVVEKDGIRTYSVIKFEVDADGAILMEPHVFNAFLTELWDRREYDRYVSDYLEGKVRKK